MKTAEAALGLLVILVIFWDAFETLILPRRIARRLRVASIFFRTTWASWRLTARVFRRRHRESYLSFYGPLSLLFLIAVWAVGMIVGFALLQAGLGRVHPPASTSFATRLYLSGSTFVTLGLGDVTPANPFARFIEVVESGAGLGFVALVIAYLPVLYQSFSRREARISMLDARAGSPPSAGEMLARRGPTYHETGTEFLRDWELWSAEVLESHLSYPMLGYFRSQHDNQSWLGALTLILDACSLVLVGIENIPPGQARLTFAMARHAAADLASTLGTAPVPPEPDRLPSEALAQVRDLLAGRGVILNSGEEAEATLRELRASYEPYVNALSKHLLMPLPSWLPAEGAADNWEVTAWESGSGRRARLNIDPLR